MDFCSCYQMISKTCYSWEFPSGLVVRIWHFYSWGLGSIPCQGIEILYTMWCGQKNPKDKNLKKQNKQNKIMFFFPLISPLLISMSLLTHAFCRENFLILVSVFQNSAIFEFKYHISTSSLITSLFIPGMNNHSV